MTILTGVVLTIGLGAVAQRGDVFSGGETAAAYAPVDDVAFLSLGRSHLIDVVANDAGARTGDGARLLITQSPACGIAYRLDGAIAYLPGAGCGSEQRLRYCVAQGDACPEAEVRLVLSTTVAAARSPSGTPVASLDVPAAPPSAAAAISAAGQSGFRVEGPAIPREDSPFAALGALPFGSLAPEARANERNAPEARADERNAPEARADERDAPEARADERDAPEARATEAAAVADAAPTPASHR